MTLRITAWRMRGLYPISLALIAPRQCLLNSISLKTIKKPLMRTPDEIRDASIARFNELAGMKFDIGQMEHGSCLDQTVTFTHMEEEVIDMWHYIQSAKYKNRVLEAENKAMKAMLNAEGGWPKEGELD